MNYYYFTFGFGQKLNNGYKLDNHYYVIFAKDSAEAVSDMCWRFGNQWSMMYGSKEEAGVDRYHLVELTREIYDKCKKQNEPGFNVNVLEGVF